MTALCGRCNKAWSKHKLTDETMEGLPMIQCPSGDIIEIWQIKYRTKSCEEIMEGHRERMHKALIEGDQ